MSTLIRLAAITWHHVAFKHTLVSRAGVGEMVLCRARIGRSSKLHVHPEGNEFWFTPTGGLPDGMADGLLGAQTPGELLTVLARCDYETTWYVASREDQ